jgi:hypothetical protein
MNPGDVVPQTWLGRVDRGLRIALKGLDASWDSPEDYPKSTTALASTSWANCEPIRGAEAVNRTRCKGVVSVATTTGADGTYVRFSASLGAITLAPKQTLELPFDLLVTPLKPVNLRQHFATRYWHFGGQFPPPNSGLSTEQAIDQMLKLNSESTV